MHLRRRRSSTPATSSAPAAPPCATTRAAAESALELIVRHGPRAAHQARVQSVAAFRRENVWAHARLLQAERLILALERWPEATARH